MPDDLSIPVIMICTGCGIAPFRSFWLDRAKCIEENKSKDRVIGDFILFYGCREEGKDFLYKNELECLRNKNVLTSLQIAFSRDPNHPKVLIK